MTPMRNGMPLLAVWLLLGMAALGWGEPARRYKPVEKSELQPRTERTPPKLEGVDVEEKLDDRIPVDLTFSDIRGQEVVLRELFDGSRPVVLTLNYSDCPMLCSQQLNGVFDALKKIELKMGDDYRMITVSIDPEEGIDRAAATKQKYLESFRKAGARDGWKYLVTRNNARIKELAEAVGFQYRFDPETGEYLHVAVTILLTPDGRVSRYLYGVKYDPRTFQLSLVEASDGKIGSTVDKVLLRCYVYNGEDEAYQPMAYRIMRLGGLFTAVLLGGVLLAYWRRESRKSKSHNSDNEPANP